MKKTALVLCLLILTSLTFFLAPIPMVQAQDIFEDGFESNDFSAWTTTVGSPATTNTQKHHGTYSAEIDASNEHAYKNIDAITLCYHRVYVRFSDLPLSGNISQILYIYTTSGVGAFVELWNDSGTLTWRMKAYTTIWAEVTSTTPVPSIDTWYCIEVKWERNTSQGAEFWINGVSKGSVAGTTHNSSASRVYAAGTINDKPCVYHIDCVVADDAYIGVEAAPTIGGFQAPSTVYANQYFLLNASIDNVNGIAEIINATISIHSSVVLKWDNATSTFSEQTDTNSWVTLDASTCIESETNSTAFKLSWNLTLNNFPSGLADVLVANTKVWDASSSGSGSTTGLFTFSYITLTLQARDADGTNLPKIVSYSGTLGNGTALASTNSDSSGNLALTTCYGTHTITTSWGSHTVDSSRSISVTADATENIDTKIQRLDSGSNYLLFSLDNTDLTAPELVGTYDWRMESVTGTGSIEFKMDNANWIKTSAPYSFTAGTQTWTSGTGTWSFSSNVFTFTVDFSTKTLSMVWDSPSGDGGGGGGGGGGYVPPEEEELYVPLPEPVVPIIPPEILPTPVEPLASTGIIIIIGSIAFVVAYGELSRRNPSAKQAFKNRAKHRKVNWRETKAKVTWPKNPKKTKVEWKKK